MSTNLFEMDFLNDVNEKYSTLEAEVDRKLEIIKNEEAKIEKLVAAEKQRASQTSKQLSYEEAITRNAQLLKSLEMAKARLRSRSAFSPVEQILVKAKENYKNDVLGAEQTRTKSTLNNSKIQNNCYENISLEHTFKN